MTLGTCTVSVCGKLIPIGAGWTADTRCHLQIIFDKFHWKGQGNRQIRSNLDTTCQLVADFQIVFLLFIAIGANSVTLYNWISMMAAESKNMLVKTVKPETYEIIDIIT
jgi:hypothetical protein